MATKYKHFNAYQIDMHYLATQQRAQVDAVKWDPQIMEDVFTHINGLQAQQRTKRYHDSWLMYLDYLDSDQHYIVGRFASANYGTTGELVHADTMAVRPNPKQVREGETEYTFFIVKKTDGLLLLQGSQKLSRQRFEEYIEDIALPVITANNLTYIQVCTLVSESFFDDIRALNTVNKIGIEVTTQEAAADENEAVRALQDQAIRTRATNVYLEFAAKRKREGMSNVIPLVRNYKDQRGVSKIVVTGKLAGAEKIIKLENSQERYKRRLEVDNNNQPTIRSTDGVLREIARQRNALR